MISSSFGSEKNISLRVSSSSKGGAEDKEAKERCLGWREWREEVEEGGL